MSVLGIDPGLAALGWAVVERAQGWRTALGLPRTATKAQCQERVRAVLGLARPIRPQHANDAAAVAVVAAMREATGVATLRCNDPYSREDRMGRCGLSRPGVGSDA